MSAKKAVEKRNLLPDLARELATETKKNKKKKNPKHNARKPQKGMSGKRSTAYAADDVVRANALAFVNARRDPWSAPDDVVFPDSDPFPVSTGKLRGRFTPSVSSFAVGTGRYWCFLVTPDWNPFVYKTKAAVGDIQDITYDATISSAVVDYSGLAASFGLYRTVAMGLRIIGAQNILAAGGTMVVCRLPPTGFISPPTFADVVESPSTSLFSAASLIEEADGFYVRWIGLSDQSAASPTFGGVDVTASGFRPPDEVAFDSNLWICMYSVDPNADLSVEVEYEFLYNSIPVLGSGQLFATKAVASSGDAVAVASVAANMGSSSAKETKSGALGPASIVKSLGGMAKSGLSELAKDLGPFGQVATDLGSEAIDWLGGLFSLSARDHQRLLNGSKYFPHLKQLMTRLTNWDIIDMHRVACAMRRPGFSPLYRDPPIGVVDLPTFTRWLVDTFDPKDSVQELNRRVPRAPRPPRLAVAEWEELKDPPPTARSTVTVRRSVQS